MLSCGHEGPVQASMRVRGVFFVLIRPPPSSTLFPYTTLFRSRGHPHELRHHRRRRPAAGRPRPRLEGGDRKSTRLNSSHPSISYAVFCLKKKKKKKKIHQQKKKKSRKKT